MNLKQRLVRNLVQSKQHKPQKLLVQLWAELQELEILTEGMVKETKQLCKLERETTQRIRAEMEARSHQSAIVYAPHQPEPQPLSTAQIFEAAKNHQEWERLMKDLTPQLREMEAQYFGR
ncbi:hypothetical protein F7734_49085 [Scytonema sp. UIC 10036]|uniref:hypothetical protein n=1 Tax=Scytonema sp. UIC 10036 TaxID=2304196 RepID=UPI0012DA61B3|nr:hypothetical protein [Scytonema sp. UIC 10036]MUG99810.1 hypothetical protein [Scytonema sp. UIC 10036]